MRLEVVSNHHFIKLALALQSKTISEHHIAMAATSLAQVMLGELFANIHQSSFYHIYRIYKGRGQKKK